MAWQWKFCYLDLSLVLADSSRTPHVPTSPSWSQSRGDDHNMEDTAMLFSRTVSSYLLMASGVAVDLIGNILSK